MSREYTYETTLTWEHPEDDSLDVEIDVEATYSVSAYIPARGPSYSSGGEPEEPAMVEDPEITMVNGKPWDEFAAALPLGLTPEMAHIALVEKLVLGADYNRMMDAAASQDEADEADWDDLLRQEREEDDRYWAEQDRDWGDD